MSEVTVEVRSALRASADEVWARTSTMEGVNEELGPWLRMTLPRAARGKSIADIEEGEEAFASVLLLLGVLPFDVHHVTVERMYPRGFDEESWSWLQRRWRHERRVEAVDGGCVVTDRVTVSPRFGPAFAVAPIVRRVFAARHAKLRARFQVLSGG